MTTITWTLTNSDETRLVVELQGNQVTITATATDVERTGTRTVHTFFPPSDDYQAGSVIGRPFPGRQGGRCFEHYVGSNEYFEARQFAGREIGAFIVNTDAYAFQVKTDQD